jgi:heme exporter protein B
LVAPIPRSAIFLGKALGIFVFLVTVEAVVVPIVALFFHLDLLSLGGVLAVVLLLGTFGVAFAGTLFGAMTAKTRARDLVLASVLFPLLSPTLLSGVSASKELLSGQSLEQISDWLLLLSVFDFVALAGGVGLFETLVED